MKKTIVLKPNGQKPEKIEYNLIKSRRKTCSISIDENASVTVRIPLYVSDRDAEKFLYEKQLWILRKLTACKEQQSKKTENNYTAAQRAALEKRYRDAAKQYIPARVSYYASSYSDIIAKPYCAVTIRGQKTRWGSCSGKGNLNFNWRLMLAPPNVLDYVVVHELCHLTHMNHSKEFWQCVETILPDYKIRKNWLREHGHELTLS